MAYIATKSFSFNQFKYIKGDTINKSWAITDSDISLLLGKGWIINAKDYVAPIIENESETPIIVEEKESLVIEDNTESSKPKRKTKSKKSDKE